MADWDEVKRLAADFQKVQLSSTTQRLSERNCIEIVSWLLEKKMIDLIFTSDGKEYITPPQLVKDIQDELYVSGGRINLVDLAKIIGVDLAHINSHLNAVLKAQKSIHHILGQLVDATYITKIVGEINEKLSQLGQINVSDLTIQYDLPADFLQHQVLEKNLGKLIHGKQDKSDPKIFFTETFILRSVAKIRGALTGLTKPAPVSSIINNIDMSEKLFFSLFDQASVPGILTSRLPGAQYVPNIYSKSQNEWVQNFYKQNGYLEYDALSRLGISDHKLYLKKHLANENVIFLSSCVISKTLLERVDGDVEECISSKSYLDLQNNLPSVFNDEDIQMVLKNVMTNQKKSQTIVIENFVLSKIFVESLIEKCAEMTAEKATEVVNSGKYQQYQTSLIVSTTSSSTRKEKMEKVEDFEEKSDKREERRKKAAGGKTGGGTQGRETKTKSTKKGGAKNKAIDDDDTPSPSTMKKTLEVVSKSDIKKIVAPILDDEGLDELVDNVVEYLLPILNEQGMEKSANIYATTVSDRTANRRATHNDLQEKINAQITDVRLFEKGIKQFPNDVQLQLYKYLLKTICTEIVNDILNYQATENNLPLINENSNNDQRLKFLNDLPNDIKNPLTPLIKSLSASNIDDFMASIDNSLACCSMIVKKIDKKKDRTMVLNHRFGLVEQLNKCEDLALVLHLATLVIFTTVTQAMLHASGRHVAAVLSFLKQYLASEQYTELSSYHDYVMLMLNGGSEEESVREKLKELVPRVKNIANEFKKPGSGSEKS